MVDPANTNTTASVVAILTRAPSAGGKTRLFAALQRKPDPTLLEALLVDTIDNTAVPGIRRVVCVTPPSSQDEIRAMVPSDVDVIAQDEGTLGDRMREAMRTIFIAGAWAVALIGSDIPSITSRHIAAAFELLSSEPSSLVLGPSRDGGYYLIAATSVPDVFRDIEWGSARVLLQTQAAARAGGLQIRLLERLSDVDTTDALLACAGDPGAVRTSAWIREQGLAPR